MKQTPMGPYQMYNKLATFLATRIGDCIGAVAAGLLCIVIAQRSPDEAAFIYLGMPLLLVGVLSTLMAVTSKG